MREAMEMSRFAWIRQSCPGSGGAGRLRGEVKDLSHDGSFNYAFGGPKLSQGDEQTCSFGWTLGKGRVAYEAQAPHILS